MRRFSKQREVIAENLKHRTDHPSADMVYESVKVQLPKISLGTVYRNLKELTAEGDIISFMANGREHFDGNASPHMHICCNSCGSIEDRFLKADEILGFSENGFVVQNIILHGVCHQCRQVNQA